VTLFLLPAVIYKLVASFPRRRNSHQEVKLYKRLLRINRVYIAATVLLAAWLAILAARYSRLTGAVGAPDFAAFATSATDTFSAWGSVLTLRGFWYSGGVIPPALELLWLLLCATFVALIVYAIVTLHRRHPLWARYAGVGLVFAVVLAVGYGSPFSQWVTDIMRHIVPGYSGLRETQKIAGLVAFAYALAAPFALRHLWLQVKDRFYATAGTAIVLVVYVLCMSLALTNVYPKLHTYRYPSDWRIANAILTEFHAQRVLVLPWNGYLPLPFANDAFVANPSRQYFAVPTDARRNSGNYILDNARGDSLFDHKVLSLQKNYAALPGIRAQGYDYILLLHTEGYESYQKRLNQAALEQIYTGKTLTIYSTHQKLLNQSF
jgi:hypothetical protein